MSPSTATGTIAGSMGVALPLTLAEVYAAEASYVARSLRRLGVRDADLEDEVHEVFVIVHRKLVEFDTARALRPWLFGIAFRRAADYRRLVRNVLEFVSPDPEAVDASPAADEVVARRQVQALVLAALEQLDMDRRAVFIMHDVDEIGAPDVAHTLEIPVNTVYSRLRLARRDFAAAVARLRRSRGEP